LPAALCGHKAHFKVKHKCGIADEQWKCLCWTFNWVLPSGSSFMQDPHSCRILIHVGSSFM
jgi:hypothetical protein